MASYGYNKQINPERLNSEIVVGLFEPTFINYNSNTFNFDVNFENTLGVGEKDILDGIVATHLFSDDSGDGVFNSVSATTFTGDGSALTGIPDTFITGATFSGNQLILGNNNNTILNAFLTNLSGVTFTGPLLVDGIDITSSSAKSYGEIYMNNNNVATTIVSPSTPVKVAGVGLLGGINNFSFNSGLSRLTFTGTTTESFEINVSLTAEGSGNALFLFYIGKNGVLTSNTTIQQQFSSTRGSISINGILELSTNDYVELFVQNDTNNKGITVNYSNFTLTQL